MLKPNRRLQVREWGDCEFLSFHVQVKVKEKIWASALRNLWKGWLLLLKVGCSKTVKAIPSFALLLDWGSLEKLLKLPWKLRSEAGRGDLVHPSSWGSLAKLVTSWSRAGYSSCPVVLGPASLYTMPYPVLFHEISSLGEEQMLWIGVGSMLNGLQDLDSNASWVMGVAGFIH